eukprot:6477414-Alexandrium_andersonii.AAC.1
MQRDKAPRVPCVTQQCDVFSTAKQAAMPGYLWPEAKQKDEHPQASTRNGNCPVDITTQARAAE